MSHAGNSEMTLWTETMAPEGSRPTPSSIERKPTNPFVERQIFKLSRIRVNKDILL